MKNGWMFHHSQSIRRMILRMMVVLSVLFIILCVGVFAGIRNVLLKNAEEYQSITAQKLQNQLEIVYDKMEAFALDLSQNDQIIQLMTVPNAQRVRYVDPVTKTLTAYMNLEPSIEDIALVNDSIHYSVLFSAEDLDYMREAWKGRGFGWYGAQTSSFRSQADRGKQFVYAQEIRYKSRSIGTLFISFDPHYFQLSSQDFMDGYFILLQNDQIIYLFNCDGTTAEAMLRQWQEREDHGTDSLSSSQFRIAVSDLGNMGCRLLGTLDTNHISAEMRYIRLLIWLMVALVFLSLSGLFVMIVYRISKPLQQFRQIIKDMRNKTDSVSLVGTDLLNGCAEIKEIGQEFSSMVQERDQLNHQIIDTTTSLYEAKMARQQAELSYLRSQIDPHFLYNTLEVLRRKAIACGAEDLAETAMDMARIFRYNVKGAEQVRLSEEIEIIKSYVHLQQMRFRKRFQAFYSLPEDALRCVVAKMLLQPIVENAVIHGIEPMETPGAVFIAAKIENDVTLVLTVKDNGAGIPEDELEQLQRSLEQEQYHANEHVGILNTHARIRLQYGHAYGLSVESRVGDGTTVQLRIPAEPLLDGREN